LLWKKNFALYTFDSTVFSIKLHSSCGQDIGSLGVVSQIASSA